MPNDMYTEDEFQQREVAVIDDSIMQIEKAQIDMQIATAKRYPREIQRVKKNMIAMATLDEETASACFFVLPRGGKSIQGKSVRLAEIALSCYGNVKAATRVVNVVDSGNNPHVVVQAAMLDMENNVAISIEKRRRIVGKIQYEGSKKVGNKPPSEDDINLAVNACSAIAFRDAVFKVIPGALTKPVYDAAVGMATGGNRPIESQIARAFEKFAQIGIFKDRILAMLEKDTSEELVKEDLIKLIGIYNAIRDGESSIEACFPKSNEGRSAAAKNPMAGMVPADVEEKNNPPPEKPKEKTEPAAAEKPPAEEKPETAKKTDSGLTQVIDMQTPSLIAEMKHHADKPYYGQIVRENGAAEVEPNQCPISMLQDIVFACREAVGA